jgi:dipeptidyl aminopeptidase/acylaminoacyl peptidase
LILVGNRDGEVPREQSVEGWHGLVAQHVPTKPVVYPQDGDRFIEPADARDFGLCALEWFEGWLAKAK